MNYIAYCAIMQAHPNGWELFEDFPKIIYFTEMRANRYAFNKGKRFRLKFAERKKKGRERKKEGDVLETVTRGWTMDNHSRSGAVIPKYRHKRSTIVW